MRRVPHNVQPDVDFSMSVDGTLQVSRRRDWFILVVTVMVYICVKLFQ